VRCIEDSSSHPSYILKEVAERMKWKSMGETMIQHGQFSGMTSVPETHKKYSIQAESSTTSFKCYFDVFG
jgi:hypothetical protein